MIEFLILLLHVLMSPFKTQAQVEAEIVLLRHQRLADALRRHGVARQGKGEQLARGPNGPFSLYIRTY